jgi:hypothetical protein
MIDSELIVTIGSHYFCTTKVTPRSRQAVESFARRYIEYGFVRGRPTRAPLKVFAAATSGKDEYRFHINTLNVFKQHLEAHYLTGSLVTWKTLPVPTPEEIDITILPKWKDREDQIPAIEYLLQEEPVSKFLNLQTGFGKSYITMRSIAEHRTRTVIIVRPRYIEKWILDIRRTFDIELEDILVIQGSAQLMALLAQAETGELTAKIIIISNKTMQNWIKIYERIRFETLQVGYATTPDKLHEFLKSGKRVIDEVHLDFHLNFKLDLYTNVKTSSSLSASMISDNDFVNKMYDIAYPKALRFIGPEYNKFVDAVSIIYRFENPDKIRYKNYHDGSYSHIEFENSVRTKKGVFTNYLELITNTVTGTYLKDYTKTEKCLVLCSSVEMCTLVRDQLIKIFPHLTITRYVQDDPFENILTSDICVSTLLSAGAAIDIDNLTTVILTIAISSTQSNVQSLGRLRNLYTTTKKREFYYFVCEDIPKHIEYHEKKRAILETRSLSYRSIRIGKPL